MPPETTAELAVVDPRQAEGHAVLREYFHDIVARYYGHAADDAEITELMHQDPSDQLAAPHGLLLVAFPGPPAAGRSGPARGSGDPAPGRTDLALGCAGLVFVGDGIAEVKRVFVRPEARGRGLGARLLTALEDLAVRRGLHTLRLDTRADLVEARRLYQRLGYREVPAFNAGQHCEHWYAKSLRPAGG